jgi:hypothetical protein
MAAENLARLQTLRYSVKVKHTFIELDEPDCDVLGCRPRAFSDPGEITQSLPELNDHDSYDQFAKDESLDGRSTCSRMTDIDDDASSSSCSSSSPVLERIGSPMSCVSFRAVASDIPCDFELHATSAPSPVYGVFFAPVVLFCAEQADSVNQAMQQQNTAISAAHHLAEPPDAPLDGACGSGLEAKETGAEAKGTLTTITFKNVPADCTLSHVLETLNKEGFAGCYDFVHAPVNFSSNSTLGYVHINLLNQVIAERAWHHFQGFKNWSGSCIPCDLPGCVVNWSEGYQGLPAFIERYRNSPLMHRSVPEEYKPAIFSNGTRVAFPEPTMRLKPPRVRHQKRVAQTENVPYE